MKWIPMTDMVEHNNYPRQFFDKDGEIFLYGVKREGGGPDTTIPRRIVGIGRTRGAAYADAVDGVRAYDPSFRSFSSS